SARVVYATAVSNTKSAITILISETRMKSPMLMYAISNAVPLLSLRLPPFALRLSPESTCQFFRRTAKSEWRIACLPSIPRTLLTRRRRAITLHDRVKRRGITPQGAAGEERIVRRQNHLCLSRASRAGNLHELRVLILASQNAQPRNVVSRNQPLNFIEHR